MTTTYTIKLLPTQCDLDSTFSSGQTFRWHKIGPSWFGIIGNRSVLLTQLTDQIQAQTPQTCKDWSWLEDYLQLKLNHESMIKTIRRDAFISEAIALYPGLRLLRQDPWECLASFILSSANSIPQIQRAIDLLCQRFGNPIPGIVREIPAHSFPKPEILAKAKLSDLTNCKNRIQGQVPKSKSHSSYQKGHSGLKLTSQYTYQRSPQDTYFIAGSRT